MRSSKLPLTKISEQNPTSTKSQLISSSTTTTTKKQPVRPKTAESSLTLARRKPSLCARRTSANEDDDELARNSPIENEYKMRVTQLFNDSKLFEDHVAKKKSQKTEPYLKNTPNSSTDSSSDLNVNSMKRTGASRTLSAKTHSPAFYDLKNSFNSNNGILPSLVGEQKMTSTPTLANRRQIPSFSFHTSSKPPTGRKKSPGHSKQRAAASAKKASSRNLAQMSSFEETSFGPDKREQVERQEPSMFHEEASSLQGVDRINDVVLTNMRNQVHSAPLSRNRVRFLSKLVDGVNTFEENNLNNPAGEDKNAENDFFNDEASIDSNTDGGLGDIESPQPVVYVDDLEEERVNLQESIMKLRDKLRVIERKEIKKIKRPEPPSPVKLTDRKSILREQQPIKTQSMSVDKWVEIHKRRNSANTNLIQSKLTISRPQTSVGVPTKQSPSPVNKSHLLNRQQSATPSSSSDVRVERIAKLENYLQELRSRNKRRIALKKSQIKYGDGSSLNAYDEHLGKRTRSSIGDPESRTSSSTHTDNTAVADEVELTLSRRELIDMTVLDKMQDRIKHELQENLRTIRKIQSQNEFNSIVAKIKNFLSEVEDFKYRNVVNQDFKNRKSIKLYEYEYKV